MKYKLEGTKMDQAKEFVNGPVTNAFNSIANTFYHNFT